jgi:SAM-dependent methyltransferase
MSPHMRNSIARTGLLCVLLCTPGLAAAYEPEVGQQGKDVVWVPTPQALVERMLTMAKVRKDDLVVDLGSGDGRIAITAAKEFGARAIGIEYNPQMVELSRREAARQGVSKTATFIHGDVFATDFTRATVVTAYLLPELNLKLRPKLLAMKPGTRIATHAFNMGDWEPDETAVVNGYRGYLWLVPAHVAGTWKIRAGASQYELTLRQKYQKLEGFMVLGADRTGLRESRLAGSEIHFAVNDRGGVVREFSGRVQPKGIEGRMRTTGQAETPFTATRQKP